MQNLSRLDEANEEDAKGVNTTMGVLENLLEVWAVGGLDSQHVFALQCWSFSQPAAGFAHLYIASGCMYHVCICIMCVYCTWDGGGIPCHEKSAGRLLVCHVLVSVRVYSSWVMRRRVGRELARGRVVCVVRPHAVPC